MPPDLDLPIKWKRTVNPKLLDDDNVSRDAIKRRKVEASKTQTQSGTSQSSTNTSQPSQPTTQPTPSTSQRASVEAVDDDDVSCRNAGSPKKPNTILESANDDDDDDLINTQPRSRAKESEKEEQPKETDEDELSKSRFKNTHVNEFIPITSSTFAKGLAIKSLCVLSVRS